MKWTRQFGAVSALAFAGRAVAADFPSITAKGSKFFYPNGTQFFIKGVAYQQGVGAGGDSSGDTNAPDPLADADNCKRDVPLLSQLGTNTIRTYSIDPTKDHDECMQLLQDANIYVISDLSSLNQSISQTDPKWTTDLFSRYTAVVDALQKYPNVIGFFAGNEVTNNNTNTDAAAFVKAAVRDTKKYISDKKYRWMGVGYAANDDEDIRNNIAHYFNCGDQDDAIDFWGYNIYSWCGDSDIKTSGYATEAEFFSNYSVPVFFAEYGCNTQPGGAATRKFTETAALYGKDLSPVFSGGVVYMYFEEANDYGLVKASGTSVSKLADFSALQSEVAKADPSGVKESDYSPTNKPAACPSLQEDVWVASNNLPPTPDESSCSCMTKAAGCVPASNLKATAYGDIFSYICSKEGGKYCAGINANVTSGVYGAYSMCNSKEQLTYVLDAYYQGQGSKSTACDFDGQATEQSGSADSDCKSSLASASSANAHAATATGSGNGASSTGSSDDDSGAVGVTVTNVSGLGLHVLVALAVGLQISLHF